MTNDFKHFGDKMKKITNRNIDKSYEIYLALYQAVTGTEEWKNIYKQFSPGFFDLIVVDECHRGSAAEDSQWREVLEYFKSAAQIGMTATPKETKLLFKVHDYPNWKITIDGKDAERLNKPGYLMEIKIPKLITEIKR